LREKKTSKRREAKSSLNLAEGGVYGGKKRRKVFFATQSDLKKGQEETAFIRGGISGMNGDERRRLNGGEEGTFRGRKATHVHFAVFNPLRRGKDGKDRQQFLVGSLAGVDKRSVEKKKKGKAVGKGKGIWLPSSVGQAGPKKGSEKTTTNSLAYRSYQRLPAKWKKKKDWRPAMKGTRKLRCDSTGASGNRRSRYRTIPTGENDRRKREGS